MLRPDTIALTALLAALTAIGPISTDMYLASLPEIGQALSASVAEVQFTLSSYVFGFAAGQIVYGPLSDRYGRRPVLMGALALFVATSVICGLSASIDVLIGARFLQGFGGAGAIVLARAVVRDLYSGARAGRELSLMGAIMALGPVIAPMIGGVLQTAFGWRASFVALIVFGAAAMLAVWRWLPETLRVRAADPVSLRSMLRTYRALLAERVYVANLVIVALAYAGLFAWISAASFVLQDIYALTPFTFGLAFAFGSGGYMLGSMIAARLVTRIGLGRALGVGAASLAAGGVAMLATVASGMTSAASIILPMMIYLAGIGFVIPQGIAGALTPFPDRAGAASSLLGFIQQMGAAFMGIAVGHALGLSAWPLAIAVAAMGVLALAVWMTSPVLR